MSKVKAAIISSVFVLPLATLLLMAVSPAMANSQNPKLEGDFAFSGSTNCVNASAGFDSSMRPSSSSIPSPYDSSNSVQGVRRFNGDGTGSVTYRTVLFGMPNGAASAVGVNDLSATFTYAITADGMFTIDQEVTNGQFVAGPNKGKKTTITSLPSFVGYLSADGNSMTFATYSPGVETVTLLDETGTAVVSVSQRICSRARIGIRLTKKP